MQTFTITEKAMNNIAFENMIKKQKGFESFNKVIKLVKEHPNDEDLGKKVRELIKNK